MLVTDFEYDNTVLSSLGYMICTFNGSGLKTVSNGSQITINTVETNNGNKYEKTNSKYAGCLETTFQICKKVCSNESLNISLLELRELMRWLNRKSFKRFRFLDKELASIYHEAAFNVSRIEYDGQIVGLELTMKTNRPYALRGPESYFIYNEDENGNKLIIDTSDEEGYIYPRMEITILADGDLVLYNDMEQRTTFIANCTSGEVITMDYPLISSSLGDKRNIQNDFNYVFFRIANTVKNRENHITISLPCEIRMIYSPITKIGL